MQIFFISYNLYFLSLKTYFYFKFSINQLKAYFKFFLCLKTLDNIFKTRIKLGELL